MTTPQSLINDIMTATDHLFTFAHTADGHGSAYLFNNLVRYFDKEPAAVSITFPIIYNTGARAEATIDRHGNISIA